MNYISVKQAAEKWEMTPRRIQTLCNQGRIEGAQRVGNVWTIPENAQKPDDARKKVISISKRQPNTDILIERVWAMPNKNTFDIKPIHALICDEMTDGIWIDPFANKNKFATVTNDLSMEYDTDYHLDALDFLKMFKDESVDGVLYDPPYSPRQVSECYNNVGYNVTWDTTKSSFWGNHKREISRIVKKGGKVLTFGWNSGGIGYKYGFDISRILIVPHGGWHNDTICTVETKTHEGVSLKITENQRKIASFPNLAITNEDQLLVKKLEALPQNFWDFKEDDTKEFTHGFHSYPAMMVCPISRNIIRLVKEARPIHALFDPFAGSGTVLVEGMLAGIDLVYGSDINPLALFLAKVKTKNIDITELQCESKRLFETVSNIYKENEAFFTNADSYMKEKCKLDLTSKEGWGSSAPQYLLEYCNSDISYPHANIPDFKNIGYWFKPNVILCLQLLKNQILAINNEDVRNFALLAFSESIRLVSNRRNGEFKMFRMPAHQVDAFSPNVLKEFFKILERNIEKMNAFNEACSDANTHTKVCIFKNNATELKEIPDDTFDLIITSPPYGDSRTTVAYGEYSRLSLQWLELDSLSDKEIMSIDKSLMGGKKYRNGFEFLLSSETLKKSLEKIKDIDLERAGDVYSFYADLDAAIKAIAKKTKIGGYQFWVVGNRTVKNELLQTDAIIAELAEQAGMQYIYTIDRNISNKVMPSCNSPSNEIGVKATTMTNEHIIILKKV